MKKLHILIIFFLYFYKCVSQESSKKIIAEVGKKTYIPCAVKSMGDTEWHKNGVFILRYKQGQKFQNSNIKGVQRFKVLGQSTSDLEVDALELSDSGTYTCRKDRSTVCTVNLFVFEVLATPSKNLISSESLILKATFIPEQTSGLQVHWMKDDKNVGNGMSVEFKNMALEHSGHYWCHFKMDGADEVKTSTEIKVFGSKSTSSGIVYIKNPKNVTLPWIFSFNVFKPMLNEAKILGGNVTYPSQIIKELTVNPDSCLPGNCVTYTEAMQSLDIHLSNPQTGDYQMEIVLKLEGRTKKLTRNVCVADLTVSSSENDLSIDSIVTLLCQINCIDKNGKLCWKNMNLKHEKCGSPGQANMSEKVTILAETLGDWTCYVVVEQKTIVSVNLTLEVSSGFLNMSSYQFWVVICVGVLILLAIGIIIVIVVARSRRMRRAQKRAWLLQNLHQQRRCECKGFPPQRLKDHV